VIVWLASYPRSGNTMLRMLLHRLYGQPSYSLYEENPGGAGRNDGIADVAGSAGHVSEPELDDLRQRGETAFVKTHGLAVDDSPALCLIRDGRDALVSYAHFVRSYEPDMADRYSFDEVLRILIESRDHYGGWTGNVRSWHERKAKGRTVWLRYEDLVGDPLGRLEGAMRELDLDIRPGRAALARFGELHDRWPDFFRTGRPGAWLREMNDELHELFWLHHHEPMHWFGYERSSVIGREPT
jgi:Sulfotransferase domain